MARLNLPLLSALFFLLGFLPTIYAETVTLTANFVAPGGSPPVSVEKLSFTVGVDGIMLVSDPKNIFAKSMGAGLIPTIARMPVDVTKAPNGDTTVTGTYNPERKHRSRFGKRLAEANLIFVYSGASTGFTIVDMGESAGVNLVPTTGDVTVTIGAEPEKAKRAGFGFHLVVLTLEINVDGDD